MGHCTRLFEALRRFKWKGTRKRTCLDRKAPRDKWGYLVKPIMSDRRVDGELFDLRTELFPDLRFKAIQVNHNVASYQHKDRNAGNSWVFLFGC